MLNYIYKILYILVKSKKNFLSPKKNQILIYDSTGSEQILFLLKDKIDLKPEIMSIRGETINIPIIILNLIKLRFKKKNYINKYIEIVNPKIIITFIDNAIEFYKINNFFPSAKTIFIQNGWRSYNSDIFEKLSNINIKKEKLKVNKMLIFGSEIGKLYSKYIDGEYKVIGSLRNNYNKISKNKNKIIIYVSQWMESNFIINGQNFNNLNYSYPCDKIIVPILMDFAKKNQYKFYILTRSKYESKYEKLEKKYFFETFNDNICFFKKDKFLNSYEIVDHAEIVTGVDSTLLYESIARKKKTAVFSIRGNLLKLKGFNFGWPGKFSDLGPFWTNLPDKKYLTEILYFLDSISCKDLNSIYTKNNTNSIMVFDDNNTIASETINNLLY